MVFVNRVTGERRRLGGSGAVAEGRRLEAQGWVRSGGGSTPAISAEEVQARIDELKEQEAPKPKPKRRRASRKKVVDKGS